VAVSSRNGNQLRLYLLGVFLLLWFGAICLRLVYLQIFAYGDFEERAQHQQQRTAEISPKRGVIYDRDGRELAMSVLVDSVFAVPSEIPDLTSTISLISRITHDDPREIIARCKGRSFCWVARKTRPDLSKRIDALNLKGIYFEKEPKRYYPNGELAAQVLGYVGMDDEGLSGLEREYDDQLRGKPGQMLIQVDARRKKYSRIEKPPDPGENVVLTIDQNVQYIAEQELKAAITQTHAPDGTVIVSNPRTGEILALANWPTFNPNLSRDITLRSLKNRAVSDVYEPGSTFKLVTISAALEEHITNPREIFDCQMGSIVVNGMRIRDHKPFGLLPVSDILAKSSDVGAIKIALRLGEDRFYKYIRAFGFGQQTGIELPGETRGLAKPLNRWSKVSIGAISMGQEIGISPLQLDTMVSVIANDGVWVAPRIVAGVTEPRNTPQTVVFQPGEQRRVLSPMTAAQMKSMMEGVVLHGTGRRAILEGYSSGGKTGTAQKVDPGTHGYSRTNYVASFAGFAPVNNPAITVAVILDSPVGPHQGGQVAAPVFQRVAQKVLAYLNVPHDVELPASRQLLLASRKVTEDDLEESSPDHLGSALDVADNGPPEPPPALPLKPSAAPTEPHIVAAASREKVALPPEPVKPGGGAVTTTEPHSQGTVVLDVEQGGIVVPSFLGKSVRAAIETAESSSLELEAVGSGTASEQTPAAGSHVPAGSRIVVRFER
jgi:cell division protein FtsI (penicillin-binding protein 3)